MTKIIWPLPDPDEHLQEHDRNNTASKIVDILIFVLIPILIVLIFGLFAYLAPG